MNSYQVSEVSLIIFSECGFTLPVFCRIAVLLHVIQTYHHQQTNVSLSNKGLSRLSLSFCALWTGEEGTERCRLLLGEQVS